jgi:hypothetical protein
MINFNDGTDSDRQEASLTVNGGHYMTRGHMITAFTTSQDAPDVKNFF